MQAPAGGLAPLGGPAGLTAPAGGGGYNLAPLGAAPGGLAPLSSPGGGNMVPHQAAVGQSSAAGGGFPADVASAQASLTSLEAAKAAAVEAEDYARAKDLKSQVDVARSQVEILWLETEKAAAVAAENYVRSEKGNDVRKPPTGPPIRNRPSHSLWPLLAWHSCAHQP